MASGKMETFHCPGAYCGVVTSEDASVTNCSACPWGYRPGAFSVCKRCVQPMLGHDWLYLGFMVLLSFVLHCITIDINTNRKSRRMMFLHLSALLETGLAAVSSLLIMEPMGSLSLYSCGVTSIQDWYPVFYNPVVEHSTRLHCTQEIVYPLYTIVMIFYSLQLPAMLLCRPIFSSKRFMAQGIEVTKPVYSALYFLPLLVLVQATFGGVLYYCFPYVAAFASVISLIIHLSHFQDQHWFELSKKSLLTGRSLAILLVHFLLHAYAILTLADVTNEPQVAACLLLLVPVPYMLYIMAGKETDPEAVDGLAREIRT